MLARVVRTTALVGVSALVCAVSLVACGQEKACASDLPMYPFPQSVAAKGGGGGGGHGVSGGSHGGGEVGTGSRSGTGSHEVSGESHPEEPHPASAPDIMPGAHEDATTPGWVTYPGWPGRYPRGVFPPGYAAYYGCRAQPSPSSTPTK